MEMDFERASVVASTARTFMASICMNVRRSTRVNSSYITAEGERIVGAESVKFPSRDGPEMRESTKKVGDRNEGDPLFFIGVF